MKIQIKNFILDELKEKGSLTTSKIQESIMRSGIGKHRYPILRKYYLEILRKDGIIRLLSENKGAGGGLWEIIDKNIVEWQQSLRTSIVFCNYSDFNVMSDL